MNEGIIAARYARALVSCVAGSGRGEQVFTQAGELLAGRIPTALEPDLMRFVSLLASNGRSECLRAGLQQFCVQYCESKGMKMATLVTAVPAPGLEEKLRSLVRHQFGCEIVLEVKVDPSIEGGFVFTLGDRTLDASVKRQVELIRRRFVEKVNRII